MTWQTAAVATAAMEAAVADFAMRAMQGIAYRMAGKDDNGGDEWRWKS